MDHFVEKTKRNLLRNVALGRWLEVMEIYRKYPASHEVKMPKTGDTTLHIAISYGLESSIVGEMVAVAGGNALAIGNEQGNTPLHLAASLGNQHVCRCIVEKDSNLIGARNDHGETPLFLASTHGGKHTFLYLHHFCKREGYRYAYYRRNNGDTILHSAIFEQHFDIAYYIIHQYPKLVHKLNEDGVSPLHLLASMPSAFPTGTHLTRLRKLIYHCISVGEISQISHHVEILNPSTPLSGKEMVGDARPPNCATRLKQNIIRLLGCLSDVGHWKNDQHDEEAAKEQGDGRENNQQDEETANKQELKDRALFRARGRRWTCKCYTWLVFPFQLILKLMMAVFKLAIFVAEYECYESLKRVKERCTWSVSVMTELLIHSSRYAYEQRGICPVPSIAEYQYLADLAPIATNKMETPLLIAAKHGVMEMVEGILEVHPDAVFDVNTEKKNIVMLAVEYRHPRLYEFLLRERTIINTIFGQVDRDGNSVLHIAAKLEDDQRAWRIRGAALEMYMEVKWYKFVKHSMPPGFFIRHNHLGQTAGKIFTDNHLKLIQEGREWLTSYSQSASLVSALIATVAYPTSATVPGGIKQDSGSPTLKDEPIFLVSAISSLTALCFSMVALVMFMVIPTSSFRKRDFRKSLPLKLLLGLISLFVSILSMLVSFCTGHFFVLRDKLKNGAVPVYALCCLPLVVFICAQFLLDFETVWITLKKRPRHQQRK